jgi:hypothetical protein
MNIFPRASTLPTLSGAPQGLNYQLLIAILVLVFREHKTSVQSYLILSRPREAEAGVLRIQGLEIAGKTNPSKT